MLGKSCARTIMPSFDLRIGRVFPLGARRVLVGEVEVRHVPDVTIVTATPRFRDTEDDFLSRGVVNILKDGPNTQVLRVPVHNFGVGCGPCYSGCFAVPGDASPEVYPFFYAAFLALVACNLRQATK